MNLKPNVGRAEMEVLRYVSDHPGSTVGEVGEYLAETKGHTRNTALNVMERLRTKGDQFAALIEPKPTAMKSRRQPILMTTMEVLKVADSRTPRTWIAPARRQMRAAGRLMMAPVGAHLSVRGL